jgi:hypothetical protein
MAAGLSAVARRYLHPRIVANLLDPAGGKDLAERQQPTVQAVGLSRGAGSQCSEFIAHSRQVLSSLSQD